MHPRRPIKDKAGGQKSPHSMHCPLLDSGNLIQVESWNLTHSHATDVVRLRQVSRKSTRLTKKLESSLDDECGIESVAQDTWLHLESSKLKSEDRVAADVVRLRKSSRKSARHSLKLESLPRDKRFAQILPDKTMHMHAVASFHKTLKLATLVADGNSDKGWLSDILSDISTRPSSSIESSPCTYSAVLSKDMHD